MRHVMTYRFTDEDVRAVVFGYAPASAVRYEDVEEARAISALQMPAWPVWRAQNRLFGPAVLTCGRGFFPVLCAPDDVEGFAREPRRRVYRHTGQPPLGR